MSTICKKITFHMKNDEGDEWESILEFNDGDTASMEVRMTPETESEIITIVVVRKTERSREYASYVKSQLPWRKKVDTVSTKGQ